MKGPEPIALQDDDEEVTITVGEQENWRKRVVALEAENKRLREIITSLEDRLSWSEKLGL